MSHYCGVAEARGKMPCMEQCDECAEYEKAQAGDVEPDYTEAERLIGREICQETRKYDLREMKRAANPRLDKC